jgi:valyl-tRNA synthetase
MLGDTAVAVHPDDPRYRHLIGATVKLPLAERDIPIIADTYVDPEFGSGCVKITPAHDFNDHAIGERHGLPLVNVLTDRAAINNNAPSAYRGLDCFEARKRIVADLQRLDLVERIDDHLLQVPRGERSGAIIEPFLTDQWFVKVAPLAAPAIEAVESGAIEFVPKQYENVYFAWMRNIQDWCISRQQWWGHRIPAWYDADGNVYVGHDEHDARVKNGIAPETALTQDEDVLETWFSSSLWTFATLGWPEQTAALEKFHPTDILITGHDIIFFWVARMIMMTLKFTGDVPFRQVHITGLVRDAEGEKMSKTRGNGVDPLDIVDGITLEALVAKRTSNLTQPQMAARIEATTRKDHPEGIPAYGTDALRFTCCALASTGRDMRFDLARVEGYRNFCNKLWNASRFVLGSIGEDDLEGPVEYTMADLWIRSRANHLVTAAALAIDTCRFDLYANAVYEFVWREYCDWYLELTKPVLWDDDASVELKRGARRTLLEVLELLLRASHPVMPFITESIWREVARPLGKTSASIMIEPWPDVTEFRPDPAADETIEWLKQVVLGVRNVRGEARIKPAVTVDVLLQGGSSRDVELAAATSGLVKRLARVGTIDWLAADAEPPVNALTLVGDLKVMVPLAGLIDVATERDRLGKELERRSQELERVSAKLANQAFVAKAPAAVVDKERAKAAEIEAALATLRDQLATLG